MSCGGGRLKMPTKTNYKSRYGYKFDLKTSYFITYHKKKESIIDFDIGAISFETKGDAQFIKTIFRLPLIGIKSNEVMNKHLKQVFNDVNEIIDVEKPLAEREICFGCAKLTKSIGKIEYARLNYGDHMTEKQLQSVYTAILKELDRFRTLEIAGKL